MPTANGPRGRVPRATPWYPGEIVLREGAANLQRGAEAVGGRLWLTDRRLIFEAHAFNLQAGALALERAAIQAVVPGWSLLFGLLPLWPNALLLTTVDGHTHRFTVFGNRAWAAALAP